MPSGGGESVRLAVLSIVLASRGLPEAMPQALFCMWLQKSGIFEQVKAALLAGKHVIVTKPMGVSLEEVRELVRLVDSGEFEVAFAMFPVSVAELMNIADSGQVMPPKSTWFEPKLRSGLLVHTLDD